MNAYKKYILFALGIPLPFIVLFVINLYLYDPVQIFHKPYFGKTTFFSDMRVAARGIIEHYDFDSYILGTSMLENTSAREAKEKLGGEWVNISLSGSTFGERAIVMEYLFRVKQPKNILYSLDYLANVNESIRDNIPSKLYDNSKFNDFTFYINDRFVLCSLVWNKTKHCVGDKELVEDSIVSWIGLKEHSARFGGIENWVKLKSNSQIKDASKAILQYDLGAVSSPKNTENLKIQIQETIKKDIIKFIRENKETHFYFIVPTYSRLNYKINSRFGGNFVLFYQSLLWLTKELEQYPNVTLYGFDTLDYADEITNYRDLTHYNVDMNSMQLEAIREDTHRLTSDNVEEYLRVMEKKIQEYDAEPLIKIVKEALEEK